MNRFELLGILTAKEFRRTEGQEPRPYACFQIVTEYLFHALDTGKAEYSKDIIDLVSYKPCYIDRLKRIQIGSWVYVLGRVVQLRRHSQSSGRIGIPYLSVINLMQLMAPKPGQVMALPMNDPEKEMPKFTRKRMMEYLAWVENHPEAEQSPLEQTVTHQADDGTFVPGAEATSPHFALPGPVIGSFSRDEDRESPAAPPCRPSLPEQGSPGS